MQKSFAAVAMFPRGG